MVAQDEVTYSGEIMDRVAYLNIAEMHDGMGLAE
jgi:hypothetical protein